MWPLVLGAFGAGLMGSPHCVGMCGAFAACGSRTLRHGLAFHSGRLLTYAALGGLAGSFGAALPLSTTALTAISATLLLGFAGILGGVFPPLPVTIPGLPALLKRAAGAGAAAAFPLGLATGLLPCGLVYAALALPISTGNPTWGALAMIGFGLGTVPLLSTAAGSVQALMGRGLWARRALAGAVLFTGLISLTLRATVVAAEPESCHQIPIDRR